MDKYTELARCVDNVEKDASKFFVNGNKAAGTRARKHLQELKQLAQDLRVLIQDTKNDKTRPPAAGAEHDADAPHDHDGQPQYQHHLAQQPHHAPVHDDGGGQYAVHHSAHLHHGAGGVVHHPQGPYEDESNVNVGF